MFPVPKPALVISELAGRSIHALVDAGIQVGCFCACDDRVTVFDHADDFHLEVVLDLVKDDLDRLDPIEVAWKAIGLLQRVLLDRWCHVRVF